MYHHFFLNFNKDIQRFSNEIHGTHAPIQGHTYTISPQSYEKKCKFANFFKEKLLFRVFLSKSHVKIQKIWFFRYFFVPLCCYYGQQPAKTGTKIGDWRCTMQEKHTLCVNRLMK